MKSPLCPRCQIQLFEGAAGGITMHACGGCGGVWLDNVSAQRLSQALPGEAVTLAESASRAGRTHVDTAALIPCPVCAKALSRTRVASAGVDIDVCSAHGTWFDRDELQQVATAMKKARAGHAPVGVAGVAGVGLAAAGVGLAGVAVAQGAQPNLQHQTDAIATGLDVVGTALDVADVIDVGDAVDLAGAALHGAGALADGAGVVAEAGGGLIEGAFSLVAGIFDFLSS
jgi:Zn-finger nucleic acid-binding protein